MGLVINSLSISLEIKYFTLILLFSVDSFLFLPSFVMLVNAATATAEATATAVIIFRLVSILHF